MRITALQITLVILTSAVILIFMLLSTGPIIAHQDSDVHTTDGEYISWAEHRIDDQELAGGIPLRGADGLEMADLDNDGLLDIVSVHEDTNYVRIAFGTDDPNRWESFTLDEGERVDGVEDPAIGDINGDGYPDLLVAVEGGRIIYYQNPGRNVRDMNQWRHAIPTVSEGTGSWIKIYLADFNQDGRLEAVATNKSIEMYAGQGSMEVPDSPVSWFEIPTNPLDADSWAEHPIGHYRVPVNSESVDIDGDGDLDVIAGSRGEARLILFRNDSSQGGEINFTEIPIDVTNRAVPVVTIMPKMLSGMVMAYDDLNNDGRIDIITFEAPWRIVWLEQPAEFNQPWQIHPISSDFPDSPIALTLTDINEDGRLDLLTGGYSQEPRDQDVAKPGATHRGGGLWWLEQPADLSDSWQRHSISRRSRGMFDILYPQDINQDGVMDFVGTRGNSAEFDGVFWLEQRRTKEPTIVFQQARASESEQLALPPRWVRMLPEGLLARMAR